jgi:curved DNA-binding protein CbpA
LPNHYDILGVPRNAATSAVREAYLRMARERHPDRFTDPAAKRQAEESFRDITTAFNTLSNERLRQEYDAELASPRPTTPIEIAAEAFSQGLKCIEAQNFADAATCLRVAVHNAPNEARYHLALGRALVRGPRAGREAIEALETATRLAPSEPATHLELARGFVALGMRLRAQRALEAALHLAPQDAAARKLAREIGYEPGAR